ncbi:MAG: tetratricopeptide repeat protein [Sideroxydans sp.]|nr:tetratricopeptide repeat protein [Sideroxydans sp.]
MLRLSCLFACLLLAPLSAQAADQGSIPAAAPAANPVDVVPLAGDAAADTAAPESAPVMDSVQSAAPFGSEAAQRQLAQKKIGLLRATVKATTVDKGFLSGLFSTSVRPVDSELLLAMDRFIAQYPELPDSAEVYQLKAQVHLRIENYRAAALDWLMSLAAYPDSSYALEARNGLKSLVGDQLKPQAQLVLSMMQKLDTLSGGREERVAGLLAFMGTSKDKDFAAPIAAECNAFLTRNRDLADEDRVVNALAHQKMLLDNESAIFYFNELLALYPDSPLRADSLLSMGNIQRNGLKHYEEAVLSFNSVIAKYPDTDEAKQAYEALANMYDENMRDYSNAIKTYNAIAARYKDDPVVLRSLQALASIYQDKTHQPLEAIATYRKLADTFKNKDGLSALLKAEKLAYYTVSDWKLAIEINRRIVNDYPDDDEAVKAMYANAVIYEEKLKDREQAIKLYQELIAHYPGHNLAKDAQRRSSALEQKK